MVRASQANRTTEVRFLCDPAVATSIAHGKFCTCTLLAAACGVPDDTVSYYSCLNGIQKRWQVTCRHGAVEGDGGPQKAVPALGELNAVSAILVSGC